MALLQGILPIDRSTVLPNVVAGFTLAALAIPEAIGYTKISGTPMVTGLYTLLLPMALYALFGSSRHLVVGADSATAAILASGLASVAIPRSSEWVAFSGLLALITAGFLLVARLARLGFLANFLSRTVLVGFLTGVGIHIAVGEVSGMLGVSAEGHCAAARIAALVPKSCDYSAFSALIAASVLVVVGSLRKISAKVPGPLVAVIGAIVASWALDLRAHGIQVVGSVPGGLPRIGLPPGALDLALVKKFAPTAFAMAAVILAQSAATARAYASRYNERFDENVDLVALSLANIGAGLSGSFVVNGSPTKTQMVDSAGGRNQLAQLSTSCVVLVVLLFLTGPLAYLPGPALSAVVFLIGIDLIDMRGMREVWAERPWEFWVALTTAGVVILVGVEQSIFLAIALSLAVHTRHGYLVSNKVLTTSEGSPGFRQQPVAGARQIAPGLIIYRFMHSMYYANAQVLQDEVTDLARKAAPPLSWFCIDAAAVDDVDFTAAETLRRLHLSLAAQGVRLVMCEVVEEVRRELDRSRVSDLLGESAFFETPAQVLLAFEQRFSHP